MTDELENIETDVNTPDDDVTEDITEAEETDDVDTGESESTEEDNFNPWADFDATEEEDAPGDEPPAFDEAAVLGLLAKKGYTIVAPDGSYTEDVDEDGDVSQDMIQEAVNKAVAPLFEAYQVQEAQILAQRVTTNLAKKYGIDETGQEHVTAMLLNSHDGAYKTLLGMTKEQSPAGAAAREVIEALVLKAAQSNKGAAMKNGVPVPRRFGGAPAVGKVNEMAAAEKSALRSIQQKLGIQS